EDGIRDLIVTGVQTCALPIFISRAEAQKADDDVMRFRQFEGNAVALVFLDADAVTGCRLACDGQVRLADYQPLRFNQTANTKDRSEERRVGKEWRTRWVEW